MITFARFQLVTSEIPKILQLKNTSKYFFHSSRRIRRGDQKRICFNEYTQIGKKTSAKSPTVPKIQRCLTGLKNFFLEIETRGNRRPLFKLFRHVEGLQTKIFCPRQAANRQPSAWKVRMATGGMNEL